MSRDIGNGNVIITAFVLWAMAAGLVWLDIHILGHSMQPSAALIAWANQQPPPVLLQVYDYVTSLCAVTSQDPLSRESEAL